VTLGLLFGAGGAIAHSCRGVVSWATETMLRKQRGFWELN